MVEEQVTSKSNLCWSSRRNAPNKSNVTGISQRKLADKFRKRYHLLRGVLVNKGDFLPGTTRQEQTQPEREDIVDSEKATIGRT